MPGILVDTNVLVYAHDPADEVRHDRALEVLVRVYAAGYGRLSTQTLAEFFVVATRGPGPMLTTAQAARQMERLALTWLVFDVTSLVVIEAARGVRTHRLLYWDAQLWATVRLNQASTIFSEDFSAGSVLDGVRFVNPFADDFVVADWL